MMKLMKYELLRRKQLLIGAGLSILFAEGLVLLGIYNGGTNVGNSWSALTIGLTALIIVGGLVLTFLDAVMKVYSDFKHKHGFMIFMTPQNGYRVIWAKTIFAVLEMITAVIVIAGCLAITAAVADPFCGGAISAYLTSLNMNAGYIVGCAGLGLLQIIAQLSIAVLAVTVSRAIVRSGSYNWLIALLMYFALALVVNMVNGWLLAAFGAYGEVMRLVNGMVLFDSGLLVKHFVIGAATYTAWFAGCTLLSGRLVKRGIDL